MVTNFCYFYSRLVYHVNIFGNIILLTSYNCDSDRFVNTPKIMVR